MVFPAGVTLSEVTLPAASVWQGGASTITATLTPTRTVFHRKTGELLAAVTGTASGPSGAGLVMPVPHGQQSGYRDAAGNSITGWEYEVSGSYKDAAGVIQQLRKQIKIPATATSINLLTAVNYEPRNEFADRGEALLPTRLSGEALAATYVQARATAPDHATVAAYVDTSASPAALKVWDGTAWVTASGSGPTVPTTELRQIANRTMVSAVRTLGTISSRTGKTDWSRHYVSIAGTSPKIALNNVTGTGVGTTAVTYGAAIEVAGTVHPFTFGGQAKVTLQPGTAITSDPIPGLTLPVGFVKMRTWTGLPLSTDKYPTGYGMYLQTANDGTTRDTTGADLTLAGSGSAFNATNSAGTGPVALMAEVAIAANPAFAIAGDSTSEGFSDGYTTDQTNSGFAVRGISAANRPYINYAVSSDKVQLMTTARRAYWFEGVESCTHAITSYAINDITGSRTLAQLQADSIDLWYYFAGKGLNTRQTTCVPRTTTTDAWATEANQTVASAPQETVRQAWNAWLRDGAPIVAGSPMATGSSAAGTLRAGAAGHPLTGVIDTAATIESTANPGKWKFTTGALTGDGLHPTPLGYSLMAAPVQTWAAAAMA